MLVGFVFVFVVVFGYCVPNMFKLLFSSLCVLSVFWAKDIFNLGCVYWDITPLKLNWRASVLGVIVWQPVLQGYIAVTYMSQKGPLQGNKDTWAKGLVSVGTGWRVSILWPRKTCHKVVLPNPASKAPSDRGVQVKGGSGKGRGS